MEADEVELTLDDLRAVARYAAEHAERVLPIFESREPEDPRPREAVRAAWAFAGETPRTNLQRTAAVAAHRAAKDAGDDAARHAGLAAGDAAAAAYLHPIARATQVAHILRATAHAARATELAAGDDPRTGDRYVAEAAAETPGPVVAVLRRYPVAPTGHSRVAQLMTRLDAALRER